MLFPTLSTSLLGFATLAIAAPHLHSRFEKEIAVREEGSVVARGIQWTPRSLYPRKNSNKVVQDITITEFSESESNSNSRNSDVELVQILQKEIIVIDNSQEFRDNVRRNTFKNKNSNVNTVLIIVTEVIDERDSNNKNTRYLTRQIQSNSEVEEQVLIVISESNQFTVGSNSKNSSPTGISENAASSTGSVQQFGTYDPSAPAVFGGDNSASILPQGASPPSWSNAKVSQDPAEILLENPSQGLFVEFVNEESNSNDVAIVLNVSN